MAVRLAPPATRGVLAVLCAAQFVLILHVAVVNVALVPMARDLDAAPGALQLVASGYAAAFGGALLLGGRLADTGRRRATFLAGMALFAAASALCGAAWSVQVLLLGWALQGLGAAFASPAALSLLTTAFGEGAERNRAPSAWAAVAAAGGTAGLLAGDALTSQLGWRSVFYVNVPIVAAVGWPRFGCSLPTPAGPAGGGWPPDPAPPAAARSCCWWPAWGWSRRTVPQGWRRASWPGRCWAGWRSGCSTGASPTRWSRPSCSGRGRSLPPTQSSS